MNNAKKFKLAAILLIYNVIICKAQFTTIAHTTYPVTALFADTATHKMYIGSTGPTLLDTIPINGLGMYDLTSHQLDSIPFGSRAVGFDVATITRVGTNLLIGGGLYYYDTLGAFQDNGLLVYDGNQIIYPTTSFNHPPGYGSYITSFETDSNSIIMSGIIDWYYFHSNVYDIIGLPLDANYYNYSAFPKISNDVNAYVRSIKYYNGELYAGGNFTSTNGIVDLVKLNNGTWQQVGTPLSGAFSSVHKLGTWNNLLLVMGNFQAAWGDPGDLIFAWDGTNWITMGNLGQGRVVDMLEYKGELYIAGAFSNLNNYLAKWDGLNWVAVDGVVFDNQANALATDGDNLYIGGWFQNLNGVPCGQVLQYTKTVGISENSFQLRNLKAYPNPVQKSGNVTVLCPNIWNEKEVKVQMYNTNGQIVSSINSVITQSRLSVTIPSLINAGMYRIVVTGNNFRGSVSVVVN